MAASAFAFYRGAPAVMALDLSTTPRSNITVQASGDAHISNFGLFASPERTLVFDSNDFDETLPGPWEWDVKRLAASVVIAARSNGFTPAEARTASLASVRALSRADGDVLRDAPARHLVRPDDRGRHRGIAARAREGQDRRAKGSAEKDGAGAPRAPLRQGPRQGPDEGESARSPRSSTASGGSSTIRRSSPTSRSPGGAAGARKDVQRLPGDAGREPPRARRALSIRRLRAQGRRRRERRHPLLHRPPRRPRRGRCAAPPGEGGDRVGARAVPDIQLAREPRRACRRRPAADAGDARHLPRLDPRVRPAATSTSASCGT